MNTCKNCKVRIVRHLWVVEGFVYCSPVCERGKSSRYSDKVVNKIGCGGLTQ